MSITLSVQVWIWFDRSSSPIIIEDARATYQKGDLFCVELDNGFRFKYPLDHIFCVKEVHGQTSQPKKL